MKRETKRFVTFILAILIILQTIWGNVIYVRAEGEHQVQITLRDKNNMISGAKVGVTLKDGNVIRLGSQEAGIYKTGIVSENAVVGKYLVAVDVQGYESVEKEIDFAMNSNILGGELDISDYKLYQVSGKVSNYDGSLPLGQVSVLINGINVTTDAEGKYSFSLRAGEYDILYKCENYKTVVKRITVTDETNLPDLHMRKEYNLFVDVTNPEYGTVTAKINDVEVNIQNGQILCQEGDKVQIFAAPNPYYKLSGQCSNEMVTDVEDGSLYYYLIAELSDKDNCNYAIQFEKMEYAEIKYDGSSITYVRQMEGGSVVSMNSTDFRVTSDTANKYYVKQVTGDVTACNETDYGFTQAGSARVYFDKDEEGPEITLSGNDTDTLYFNEPSNVYIHIIDKKTSVKEVFYQIENSRIYSANYEYDNIYRLEMKENKNLLSHIFIIARDILGNDSEKVITVIYDTEAPTIETVSMNSEIPIFNQGEKRYINSNLAQFHVRAKDNINVKKIKYYISKETLTAEELTQRINNFIEIDVDIEGEGTYEIKVNTDSYETGGYYIYVTAEDAAGNIQTSDYGSYNFYIDKSEPKITGLEDISENKEKWKRPSDNLEFKFTLTDYETPSGLQYLYKVAKADARQPSIQSTDKWIAVGENNENAFSYTVTQEIENNLSDGTYKLWIWAKDGCDNITNVSQTEFYIDGTSPQITKMWFDVKENDETSKSLFSYPFGNFFRRNNVENKVQTVELIVKASDTANGFYQAAVPKVKEIKLYYITQDEYMKEQAYVNNIKNQHNMPSFIYGESPYKTDDGTYYFKLNVPKKARFYRLLCVASDYAGNFTYSIPTLNGYGSDQVMIDEKDPVISMTLDGKYLIPDYIENINGQTRKWYKGEKDVTYKIKIEDKDSGLAQSSLEINGEKILDNIFSTASTIEQKTEKVYTISSANGTRAKNDKYQFFIWVQDNAGNVAKKTESIYIDKEKPVITSIKFSNGKEDNLEKVPYQYKYFFKKATKVTVTATDFASDHETLGSGVKNIVYYLQKADGTKTKEKTLKVKQGSNYVYSASFTIPLGFKGQVFVKAIDNVGQETEYFNPKGVVIESKKQHDKYSYARIQLPDTTYQDNEGNPLYNYMPLVRMEMGDSKSGILKASWSIKAYNDSEAENEGITKVQSAYDEKKNKWKFSLSGDTKWNISSKRDLNLLTKASKSYKVCSEKNHMEATLNMTDNTGYLSKAEKNVFSVDMTAPVIEVEYDNNEAFHEKFYNKERHAIVTVEEANFSKENCEMIITGPDVEKSEWEHIPGSGCDGTIHVKDCKWKCVVGFIEDGDYTFSFHCTDLAGWQGDYGKVDEFTIDKTQPVIQVSYDNNQAKNDFYYKEARTATISIEEHNFAPEDVKITMTAKEGGQDIAVPEIKGWTKNDDIHTATIAYNYNGEFNFDIEYTDLANNEAEEFEPNHFVVDLEEPEIDIDGVENKSANNGKVLPIITCLDTNLEDVQITLSGANRGKVKCEFKKKNTKNGYIYEISDIAHKQEYDDLYTLSVKITDKAGNVKEDSIVYSVNRFGSVYVLDEETQLLVDYIYVNEEKELRIKEINVDSLINTNVTYSKDGEIVNLSQGKDYSIYKTGQDSSWKEYDYIINKENFQEEGRYIVTVYSEDRASNQSDNKVKGKSIEFVIDKTNPTLLISGIENHGNYREEKRNVTINAEDNIGLLSVEVFSGEESIKKFDKEQLQQLNGNLTVELTSSNNWQEIKVVTKDIAGNEIESDIIRVLLTKNIFVQWLRNPWLFYGTILTFVGFIVVIFAIYRKKLKNFQN